MKRTNAAKMEALREVREMILNLPVVKDRITMDGPKPRIITPTEFKEDACKAIDKMINAVLQPNSGDNR